MIWIRNVAEIMGHPDTDNTVFDTVIGFAQDIGMVTVPIHKEQNGYVMNSMLLPLLSSASELYVKGVSDYKSIDKTWMITMQVAMGPFGVMDMIGIETIYHVLSLWGVELKNQHMLDAADTFKKEFIDQGKLGVKTGQGFYSYPHPEYEASEFLK